MQISKSTHITQCIALLRRELHPHNLLPNLTAGLLCGVIEVTFAVSLASLIFANVLPDRLSAGVGLGLVTVAVVSAVTALTSSYPGTIAITQEVPAVILALIVSTIAAQMPSGSSSQDTFITVSVAIAFTTVLTGFSLFLLGFFKLGNLIRFIPYPVIGGFLASTGWLLAAGAISLLTDTPIQFEQLAILLSPSLLVRWLPALIFAVLLLLILRQFEHFLIVPGMLVIATLLFYITLFITGTSTAQAIEYHFLLQPFSRQESWRGLDLSIIAKANWTLIFQQIEQQVTLILLSILALLINASGIELLIKRSLDFNRELRVAGVANLLSGLAGGIVGFHSVSSSSLSYRFGTGSSTAGIVLSIVCAVTLFLGTAVISLVPQFILGGILLFLGLELLVEWLFDAWFKLSKTDYGLVIVILVINTIFGLLEGVAIGLAIAVVLFVLSYSRASVTRYILSGEGHHSRIARSIPQMRLLKEEGRQIQILELQGFIFFGTANTLSEQIYQRIQSTNLPTLKYVILNFRLVTGLDSSATLSFIKLKQVAQQQQLNLLFTQIPFTVEQQLQKGGCLKPNDEFCYVFPNLDRGLEWCENQILEAVAWRRQRTLPLVMQLEELFSNADHASTMMEYLKEFDAEAGQILFEQGHIADTLYFIEAGQVSLFLDVEPGRSHCLHTLGAGYPVGETDFFLQSSYHTSAVVTQPSTIYCLSVDAWQHLKQEHSDVAVTFQEAMLGLLGSRLSTAYREIADFLK